MTSWRYLSINVLVEGESNTIKGRLLSSGKTSIEVLTESGDIIYLGKDVIVKITLIAHTVPHISMTKNC